MRSSLLLIISVVLLIIVVTQQQQQQEAYASHSYCNTQSNNTANSSYYREECYYYDYQERLIKYTLYENSKYWGNGSNSESTTQIEETWSYYSNGILQNHCYTYSYTYNYYYSGGYGNGSTYKQNCEGYDQQGRLVEKIKLDEQNSYTCAAYCTDNEKKDNRTDYYYYTDSNGLYEHCYIIDKRNYHSSYSTSNNQYYLQQCDRKSSWVEVHEGESIEVEAWLTNGYERIYDYWSGSTGNDRQLWIKSWYDTQTKRIYTYLLRAWSYSYSGCCSGYGTVESLNPPNNNYSWDSLCHPYALTIQNYLIENGKPTGNEDSTFYRSDKFEYRVKGIYLLRNDPNNPCYIESIEPSPNNSPYLTLEQCYEYFSGTSICKRGKVSIASNAEYGEHNLYAKATYKQPWFRYWTKYYYCWSNAGGQGCRNEAPKIESGYYTNYYDIKLATAYVVQYNPQFRVYPYLAIADPNTWSYEKTVMLAIHYLGNKDQNGNINPAERVLINKLIDKEYAYQVLKGYGLPIVDPENVKQELALDMRFRVANDPYNCLSSSYVAIDSNNDSYTDELLLLQEGYYAISLHYTSQQDMQDIMLDLMNNQLADSTLQQEYYTARYTIAGEDTAQQDKQLFDFTYVYPARSFYATVVVKSVKENPNGSLEPLPVYRIKITFEDYQGSLPLLGYLYAKYQYDIWKRYEEYDQQLAYLPLCLENAQQAYQQTEYVYYNTAQGVAWIRFTSLLIGEKAKQALEVQDILDIPLQYALQAPTPYTVKIEIQPYPNSISKTNTYMLPAFQQYQQYVYYANNGFYIWNDRYVHRYGDKLLVEPARYFRIAELYISNDQGVQQVDPNLCRIGCTLYAGYGSVNLVARDGWFGTALAGYPAIAIEPPRQDPYIGWTMLAVTVLVSFFLIAYLKYLRREVNKL